MLWPNIVTSISSQKLSDQISHIHITTAYNTKLNFSIILTHPSPHHSVNINTEIDPNFGGSRLKVIDAQAKSRFGDL
jgi:hypothetical protein